MFARAFACYPYGMSKWTRLTEAQIRKAEAEGQFKDLPGVGKPLPDHPEEAYASGGETVGYRIMAEAGAIPEEFKLKAAMDEARSAVQAAKTIGLVVMRVIAAGRDVEHLTRDIEELADLDRLRDILQLA